MQLMLNVGIKSDMLSVVVLNVVAPFIPQYAYALQMRYGATTLIITTLGITTFSITTQHERLISDTQHKCYYVECHILFVVMLNVLMLSFAMLSVDMLNVVMLSVVAPEI